jgi:tRNA pseudouridine55 synthase
LINGVINIYKEKGYTSFDVVAKLRGILKQKKIGHTGTLDPMAEGVLIVCLGTATKLVDMITAGDKCYQAVMLLGETTDTEDVTGNVLSNNPVTVNKTQVLEAIDSFVGDYNQIPPMYSAIKKDGKKLYEYARAGQVIERTPRPVSIYSIDDIRVELPVVYFTVHCSKGTYIRSLCRDIGEKLGCGAVLSGLKRDEVHGFTKDTALTLDEVSRLKIAGELDRYILPVDSLLREYPAYTLKPQYAKYLYNGNKLYKNQLLLRSDLEHQNSYNTSDVTGKIRVYDGDTFVALYENSEEPDMYKPYKMFLDTSK